MKRASPAGRTALLTLQSHGDRSFLDGRDEALLSGDLRALGLPADIVHAILDPRGGDGPAGLPAQDRLAATLAAYDVVLFERVWDPALVARLRAAHPTAVWVWWQGEHALADPPADWVVLGTPRHTVPALLRFLRHQTAAPPAEARFRQGDAFTPAADARPAPRLPLGFTPNLHPVVVNPEAAPGFRTFSVVGNQGCPYQADARANPLYAGVTIPDGLGRGCAFCTTGNHYVGAPAAETAARVAAEIRYLRQHAPALDHLVLLDQNPFAYLTEVVEGLAAEGTPPFTLLLETRADWFRRSRRRFEQALAAAREAGFTLAPFLIGIESFSQTELDRFNKGITAEENLAFLETLWEWRDRFAPALTLDHAAFGFILLSPWTTRADLRDNLAGIRRTRLDQLRGSLLVSRARLYPDTALYYLAQRDGLLLDAFTHPDEDNSARYGYYPSQPWRFLHDDVAHFSALAAELTRRLGSRDQVLVFQTLLDAFDAADDWRDVTADQILAALRPAPQAASSDATAASPELRARFARLIRPLQLDAPFADGWRFGPLALSEGRLRLRLDHDDEPALQVDLAPRKSGPRYAASRHYDIAYLSPSLSPAQARALDAVCQAIVANDR